MMGGWGLWDPDFFLWCEHFSYWFIGLQTEALTARHSVPPKASSGAHKGGADNELHGTSRSPLNVTVTA